MPSTGATGYDSAAASAAPGASLTNFPFLLNVANLSASFKSALSAHGSANGIRVFSSDGSTEYARDVINVSHSGGTGWIRFQVPGATSSAITVRVYPDATGTYADTDTYGKHNAYTSEFSLYVPFDGSSPNDRTANALNMTAQGNATYTSAGKVGDASEQDSTGDYFTRSDANALDLTYGMICGWFNCDAWSQNPYLLSKHQSGPQDYLSNYRFEYFSSNLYITVGNGSSASTQVGRSWTPSNDVWYHLAARWDTGSNQVRLYVNGSQLGASGTLTTTPAGNTGAFQIAATTAKDTGRWFDGQIDEVQIWKGTPPPDAWIGYEYSQTNDNAAFWGTWTWTAAGGTGILRQMMMHH